MTYNQHGQPQNWPNQFDHNGHQNQHTFQPQNNYNNYPQYDNFYQNIQQAPQTINYQENSAPDYQATSQSSLKPLFGTDQSGVVSAGSYQDPYFSNESLETKDVPPPETVIVQSSTPFEYHAHTNMGLKQDFNEDFIDVFDVQGFLFVIIADGQGSHLGSITPSQLACSEIKMYLENEWTPGENIERAIERAFYIAHRTCEGVRKGGNGRYDGYCTSLTLFCVNVQRQMTFAHVGNTELFMIRDGQMTKLSKDDTIAQEKVDNKVIDPSEYRKDAERKVLTKAIGVARDGKPSIVSGQANRGDKVLMITDGISDHLTYEEIQKFVNLNDTTDLTTRNLVDASNERGGFDNISAAMVWL